MSYTIRPVTSEDYPTLAGLLTALSREPVTVAEITAWERGLPEGGIRQWLTAVDTAGRPLGWGRIGRAPWDRPGQFAQNVHVHPSHARQGIGTALADAGEAFAREHGGCSLAADVRDNRPDCLAFAEHRGFRRERHQYESRLDLEGFDPSRFAGFLDRVSAFRFFSMAEAEGEAAERQLYEVFRGSVPDVPGYSGSGYSPFENWRQRVLGGPWSRRDLIVVAADGDRYVAATAMVWQPESRCLFTKYTGVLKEYRGRGLALALKLLAIPVARRLGAACMRTNNDADNGPMLAVNQRLGYQPEPGIFGLTKTL